MEARCVGEANETLVARSKHEQGNLATNVVDKSSLKPSKRNLIAKEISQSAPGMLKHLMSGKVVTGAGHSAIVPYTFLTVRSVLIQGNSLRESKKSVPTQMFRSGIPVAIVRIERNRANSLSRRYKENALDDFCDSVGLVAGWTGVELHDGRLYPHIAGARDHRAGDQPGEWPPNRRLVGASSHRD